MNTLKTEITDYEDFANSLDGMDSYIAPLFGNTELNDRSDEFASARFLNGMQATTKMYFYGAVALMKGLALGTCAIALVSLIYSTLN